MMMDLCKNKAPLPSTTTSTRSRVAAISSRYESALSDAKDARNRFKQKARDMKARTFKMHELPQSQSSSTSTPTTSFNEDSNSSSSHDLAAGTSASSAFSPDFMLASLPSEERPSRADTTPTPTSAAAATSAALAMHLQQEGLDTDEGAMRFGPMCRAPSIEEALQACTPRQRKSLSSILKESVRAGMSQGTFTDEQVLQVARFQGFAVHKTVRHLKSMAQYRKVLRHQNKIDKNLEALRSHTLFCLPSALQTEEIDGFLYMRPSRYDPQKTTLETLIGTLLYTMTSIYERTRDASRKMGLICNLKDLMPESDFTANHWFELMQVLQGRVAPAQVDLLLFVNPPAWFGHEYRTKFKTMMSPDFQNRVQMVDERELDTIFDGDDFWEHLPHDIAGGEAGISGLVRDFIFFRRFVEEKREEEDAASAMTSLGGSQSSLSVWSLVEDNNTSSRPTGPVVPERARRDPTSSWANMDIPWEAGEENASDSYTTYETSGSHLCPLSSWSNLESPWDMPDLPIIITSKKAIRSSDESPSMPAANSNSSSSSKTTTTTTNSPSRCKRKTLRSSGPPSTMLKRYPSWSRLDSAWEDEEHAAVEEEHGNSCSSSSNHSSFHMPALHE